MRAMGQKFFKWGKVMETVEWMAEAYRDIQREPVVIFRNEWPDAPEYATKARCWIETPFSTTAGE